MPLIDVEILAIDCQATAARPHGHLLELGWARAGSAGTSLQTRLIRPPDAVRVPPAVTRITGIDAAMLRGGVSPGEAWSALAADAKAFGVRPVPAVVHFAAFERPFLAALAGGAPVLDLVCTHEIARRLLPDLPRRSLRALAGYFGRGVGTLRRSRDHVEATVFVWRALVPLLEAQGISTWTDLRGWLAVRDVGTGRRTRVWPMPRELRLALPRAPGVYRMLRTSGDVLYVGKAISLRDRVNSYFRQQRGVGDRMLEMLSQARDVSFEVCPSALEAALLEADEIKRHRPPYNVALLADARSVWFASADLADWAPAASPRHPLGPFPSAIPLEEFAALLRGSRMAVADGRWGPSEEVFAAGYARFRTAHAELSRRDLAPHTRALRLGSRLWREGRRDRQIDDDEGSGVGDAGDAWTAERVQLALERVAIRAALVVRRARWLTRMMDVSIAWREPELNSMRCIVFDSGECVTFGDATGTTPPVPPGSRRTVVERQAAFTVARFDRVRVLLTEVKRLVAESADVAVRFGAGPPLTGARLRHVVGWI